MTNVAPTSVCYLGITSGDQTKIKMKKHGAVAFGNETPSGKSVIFDSWVCCKEKVIKVNK